MSSTSNDVQVVIYPPSPGAAPISSSHLVVPHQHVRQLSHSIEKSTAEGVHALEKVRFWTRRVVIGMTQEEEEIAKQRHSHYYHFVAETRGYLAEFLGTFILVFFIAGIQCVQSFSRDLNDITVTTKGLVGGFVISGLIYAFGAVSGAHFNPIVTIAFFLRGLLSWWNLFLYVIFQFVGALVAGYVLRAMFINFEPTLGTTTPATTPIVAFGMEVIISFVLVSVVLATAEKAQILGPLAGVAVGSTLASILMVAWNISGASANPWRTIGPTIASGVGWRTIWVYFAGPIVGMAVAVLVQRFIAEGRPVGEKKREDQQQGEVAKANSDTPNLPVNR